MSKKVATPLEEPLQIGDIFKEYYVMDGTDVPDYFLILDCDDDLYTIMNLLSGDTSIVYIRYHPEVQIEKVG